MENCNDLSNITINGNTSRVKNSVKSSVIKKRKETDERDSGDKACEDKKFKDSNFEKCVNRNTNNGTKNKTPAENKENERVYELRNANLFIESVSEVFSIDYENPSTRFNGYADFVTFENKTNIRIEGGAVQEDFYITFMKTVKESEWGFVFSSLTTRFNSTLVAPTIIIRCIFHLILTTNSGSLLESAITVISSYWQTHQPSLAYAKKYYKQLFLESEDYRDYPASIKGKLFNDIFHRLLSSLLGMDRADTSTEVNIEVQSDNASNCNEDSSDDEDNEPSLTPDEQLNRIVIAFGLLLDLLETDFIHFQVKYRKEPKKSVFLKSRQPLIAKLELPDLEIVLMAFNACDIMDHKKEIARYVNLVAEVTRLQELEQVDKEGAASLLQHPSFGIQSIQFADTLACSIISSECSLKRKVQELALFQTWLQMYVYTHWIGQRTSIAVNPSITFVVKLLKLCLKEITEDKEEVDTFVSDTNSEMQYKKLLSEHKITAKSVHRRDPVGETKLIEMCRHKRVEIVKAILSIYHVDVSAVCNAGWTALHEATINGCSAIVRMLLQYKPTAPDLKPVDVCASSPNGITPLHEAAQIGSLEICKLLLEKGGAKLLEKVTKQGARPIDYTKSDEVRAYFKQVLMENQRIDLLKKRVLLDISVTDLILLRELTFAYVNVYCLHEIIQRHNQKLRTTDNVNPPKSRMHKDATKLKIDFKNISDNIKALRELKLLLKNIIKQNNSTELYKPLYDWLDYLM